MKAIAKQDGYFFSVTPRNDNALLVFKLPHYQNKRYLPVASMTRGIYWAEQFAGKILEWKFEE